MHRRNRHRRLACKSQHCRLKRFKIRRHLETFQPSIALVASPPAETFQPRTALVALSRWPNAGLVSSRWPSEAVVVQPSSDEGDADRQSDEDDASEDDGNYEANHVDIQTGNAASIRPAAMSQTIAKAKAVPPIL